MAQPIPKYSVLATLFGLAAAAFIAAAATSLYLYAENKGIHQALLDARQEVDADRHSSTNTSGLPLISDSEELETVVLSSPDNASADLDLVQGLQDEIARLEGEVELLQKELGRQVDKNIQLDQALSRSAIRLGVDSEALYHSILPSDPEALRQRATAIKARYNDSKDERFSFFENLDSETFTESENHKHQMLIEAIQETREVRAGIEEADRGADRAHLRTRLRILQKEIQHRMPEERRIILQDFGRSLGYSAAEADQFSDYLEYVFEMTGGQRQAGTMNMSKALDDNEIAAIDQN